MRRKVKPALLFFLLAPFLLLPIAFAQVRTPSAPPRQGFRISGTVVNALTGQAVSHAQVSIGLPATNDAVASMTTGDDGRFLMDGLSAGKYWLVAERSGFARQAYDEHEAYSTAIAVGPGLQSDDLLFRLRPDASISGIVTDDQNEAVRDAEVMLFHSGAENGKRATTLRTQVQSDDQGRYRFSHLPPGTYFVAVSARPWYAENVRRPVRRDPRFGGLRPGVPAEGGINPAFDVTYPLTFYSGATDANAATPLVLKPGDRASADIALTALPALHLRIRNPEVTSSQPFSATLDQPVFDAAPIAVPLANVQIREGAIEISGIAPGDYLVNVQNGGKQAHNWTQSIHLSSDAEISETANSAAVAITGVLKLDTNDPLPRRLFVQLRDTASNRLLNARVSPKGEFEFEPAPPGTYEVSVSNLGSALLANVSATGAKVLGHRVVIAGAGPVRLSLAMALGLGRVDGVALRDGKPVSGAMIVLVPADPANNPSLFRRDQSDSDGTFTLNSVLPGKYTVLAIANGWDLEWQNPAVLAAYMKDGENIDVSASGRREVKVKVR